MGGIPHGRICQAEVFHKWKLWFYALGDSIKCWNLWICQGIHASTPDVPSWKLQIVLFRLLAAGQNDYRQCLKGGRGSKCRCSACYSAPADYERCRYARNFEEKNTDVEALGIRWVPAHLPHWLQASVVPRSTNHLPIWQFRSKCEKLNQLSNISIIYFNKWQTLICCVCFIFQWCLIAAAK